MKTLTLFRAYEKAREYVEEAEATMYKEGEVDWPLDRVLQARKFKQALTKRLQEQEEELERLPSLEEEIHDLKMQRKDLIELIKDKQKTRHI